MPSVIRGSDSFDSDAYGGLGHNQTRQDVTASRSSGVTYTNSTGKPIEVKLSVGADVTGGAYSYTVAGITTNSSIYAHLVSVTFIVQNGATYSFTNAGSSFRQWLELR